MDAISPANGTSSLFLLPDISRIIFSLEGSFGTSTCHLWYRLCIKTNTSRPYVLFGFESIAKFLLFSTICVHSDAVCRVGLLGLPRVWGYDFSIPSLTGSIDTCRENNCSSFDRRIRLEMLLVFTKHWFCLWMNKWDKSRNLDQLTQHANLGLILVLQKTGVSDWRDTPWRMCEEVARASPCKAFAWPGWPLYMTLTFSEVAVFRLIVYVPLVVSSWM